jgi:type VI secretion system protein
MREERLLERIRVREQDPARRGGEDPRRMTDSVLEHLQRILNTKQGNVPIADDYGTPDLLDFMQSYPDSLRVLERIIRQVIQKYEPRLTAVRVNYVEQTEDALSLYFQINAKLTADMKTPVFFETLVDPDGKINIKR